MDLRRFWRDLQEQWRMYAELRKTVKPDCRWALRAELLFDPAALQRRYRNEQAFSARLDGGWRRQ